jgi:hypothetical protein
MSDQITFNNNCSRYVTDNYDDENWMPCKCPVCGGFLSGDIFQDPLICKKCGSELVALEASEKLKESDDWEGEEDRICVVTERHEIKPRAISKKEKENAKKWKAFL